VWMTTKPAFPVLGAPISPAWVHGSPRVEELALPKSLKSCNFTSPRLSSGGCRFKVDDVHDAFPNCRAFDKEEQT
jgi:hypothetical protein